MRYYIIFGITLITVLLITFYPKNYLMKFNDQITIDYNEFTNDEYWTYELSNDNLELKETSSSKWTFIPIKNGKTMLTFYYEKNEDKYRYKIIYELDIRNNIITWKNGEAYGLLDYPNPY